MLGRWADYHGGAVGMHPELNTIEALYDELHRINLKVLAFHKAHDSQADKVAIGGLRRELAKKYGAMVPNSPVTGTECLTCLMLKARA